MIDFIIIGVGVILFAVGAILAMARFYEWWSMRRQIRVENRAMLLKIYEGQNKIIDILTKHNDRIVEPDCIGPKVYSCRLDRVKWWTGNTIGYKEPKYGSETQGVKYD